MQKIFASASLIEISNVQNLMKSEGIATVIRNEHTGTMLPLGYLTEIELWVLDENQAAAARAIARQYIQQCEPGAEEAQSWQCASCREQNPGNFAVCWQCGVEHATPD